MRDRRRTPRGRTTLDGDDSRTSRRVLHGCNFADQRVHRGCQSSIRGSYSCEAHIPRRPHAGAVRRQIDHQPRRVIGRLLVRVQSREHLAPGSDPLPGVFCCWATSGAGTGIDVHDPGGAPADVGALLGAAPPSLWLCARAWPSHAASSLRLRGPALGCAVGQPRIALAAAVHHTLGLLLSAIALSVSALPLLWLALVWALRAVRGTRPIRAWRRAQTGPFVPDAASQPRDIDLALAASTTPARSRCEQPRSSQRCRAVRRVHSDRACQATRKDFPTAVGAALTRIPPRSGVRSTALGGAWPRPPDRAHRRDIDRASGTVGIPPRCQERGRGRRKQPATRSRRNTWTRRCERGCRRGQRARSSKPAHPELLSRLAHGRRQPIRARPTHRHDDGEHQKPHAAIRTLCRLSAISRRARIARQP